jgi:hypothetical protein
MMLPKNEIPKKRRDFIRIAGRSLAILSFGFIGTLAFRKPEPSAEGALCQTLNPCQTCKALQTCDLPQARAFKDPKEDRDD